MKIIKTTDRKYIGREIEIDAETEYIKFDDGFIFNIVYKKEQGDVVVLSNSNYIIKIV